MIFLFVFVFNFHSIQASDDILPVDSLLLDLTFNMHFTEALTLVHQQQALHPNGPKYFFYEAAIQFSKRPYISYTGPCLGRRARHDSLMQAIIKIATPAIDEFENRQFSNAEKMYMAGLYGYRGRAYGDQSAWFSTFRDGLKGRRLLDELIKTDSTDHNPKLGTGIFYYYTERLSGVIGLVAKILGFSGDRARGLKDLKESFEHGTYVRPESAITLLDAYVSFEDNERAGMPYFRWMIDHYPDNWIIRDWYINEMLDIGRGDLAWAAIRKNYARIDPLTCARYFYETGAYDSSREFLQAVYHKKKNYWPDQLRWAWYADSVMALISGQKVIYPEQIQGLLPHMNEDLRRFRRDASHLYPFFKIIDFIKTNPPIDSLNAVRHFSAFPADDAFYRALFNYTLGQYYLNNRIWDLAEHNLRLAEKEYPKAFMSACTKNLIWLYQFKPTDKSHIMRLKQIIEQRGFEKLKYQMRDLEALYDLE